MFGAGTTRAKRRYVTGTLTANDRDPDTAGIPAPGMGFSPGQFVILAGIFSRFLCTVLLLEIIFEIPTKFTERPNPSPGQIHDPDRLLQRYAAFPILLLTISCTLIIDKGAGGKQIYYSTVHNVLSAEYYVSKH